MQKARMTTNTKFSGHARSPPTTAFNSPCRFTCTGTTPLFSLIRFCHRGLSSAGRCRYARIVRRLSRLGMLILMIRVPFGTPYRHRWIEYMGSMAKRVLQSHRELECTRTRSANGQKEGGGGGALT